MCGQSVKINRRQSCMARKVVYLVIILALLTWLGLIGQPVSAEDPDPVIEVRNANQVTLIRTLGRGSPRTLAWSRDGSVLAVGSSAGVWLYSASDLSTPVRHLQTERGGYVT